MAKLPMSDGGSAQQVKCTAPLTAGMEAQNFFEERESRYPMVQGPGGYDEYSRAWKNQSRCDSAMAEPGCSNYEPEK